MSTPSITNLANCIEDVRRAIIEGDAGPGDCTNYHQLRARLFAVRHTLPPLYRATVYDPYVRTLDDLGEGGFTTILLRDPLGQGLGGLMLDIAQAILQNGERYEQLATDGFQEVVSDLYDGFLSAEDRRSVKLPDQGAIAPLVKWGKAHVCPYTFTMKATATFGVGAAIISLPPTHTRRGLMAWATLGHETAGHDILHADNGLHAELARSVRYALGQHNNPLAEYWANKIDAATSDVLGILNMGPAAGMGLLTYFRGLRAASEDGKAKLSNHGSSQAAHPLDMLRAYLAASAVQLCRFAQAKAWAKIIEDEADKDLEQLRIDHMPINADVARESAEVVAETIVKQRLHSLEDHALGDIQDWRDDDETIVEQLRPLLRASGTLPLQIGTGTYAAHVVAAAVTAALERHADISLIFRRMLSVLKLLHDVNPSWGPLFVAHPSDVTRHIAFDASSALALPSRLVA
jgi:hypothetical protein